MLSQPAMAALAESTQRDCIITKDDAGKWYVAVATDEYGDIFHGDRFQVFGPYSAKDSEDAYQQARPKIGSNPGGSQVIPKMPKVIADAIRSGGKGGRGWPGRHEPRSEQPSPVESKYAAQWKELQAKVKVGDAIEAYRSLSPRNTSEDGVEVVRVVGLEQNVKHGEPGFSGSAIAGLKNSRDRWGYWYQVKRVIPEAELKKMLDGERRSGLYGDAVKRSDLVGGNWYIVMPDGAVGAAPVMYRLAMAGGQIKTAGYDSREKAERAMAALDLPRTPRAQVVEFPGFDAVELDLIKYDVVARQGSLYLSVDGALVQKPGQESNRAMSFRKTTYDMVSPEQRGLGRVDGPRARALAVGDKISCEIPGKGVQDLFYLGTLRGQVLGARAEGSKVRVRALPVGATIAPAEFPGSFSDVTAVLQAGQIIDAWDYEKKRAIEIKVPKLSESIYEEITGATMTILESARELLILESAKGEKRLANKIKGYVEEKGFVFCSVKKSDCDKTMEDIEPRDLTLVGPPNSGETEMLAAAIEKTGDCRLIRFQQPDMDVQAFGLMGGGGKRHVVFLLKRGMAYSDVPGNAPGFSKVVAKLAELAERVSRDDADDEEAEQKLASMSAKEQEKARNALLAGWRGKAEAFAKAKFGDVFVTDKAAVKKICDAAIKSWEKEMGEKHDDSVPVDGTSIDLDRFDRGDGPDLLALARLAGAAVYKCRIDFEGATGEAQVIAIGKGGLAIDDGRGEIWTLGGDIPEATLKKINNAEDEIRLVGSIVDGRDLEDIQSRIKHMRPAKLAAMGLSK